MKKLNPKKYIGKKFNNWLVVDFSHSVWNEDYKLFTYFYKCKCKCGNTGIIPLTNLRSGRSKSCRFCGHTKTGISKNPLYATYIGMKNRCYNTKNHSYCNYGGRGITICKRWLGKRGFWNFVKDMGEKPSGEYSIDRIDNDKGYSPKNCRWATNSMQQKNKRRVALKEDELTQTQVAKATGYSKERISQLLGISKCTRTKPILRTFAKSIISNRYTRVVLHPDVIPFLKARRRQWQSSNSVSN